MGEFADKAKGLANEASGKVKQGVGKAVGSDKMQAEGVAQEAKGHAQKAMGDAKGSLKKTSGTHGSGDGPDDTF